MHLEHQATGLKNFSTCNSMDITIKGIPVEKLLEVYEKYEGSVDKIKSRDAKYREAHREERNQKAKEYYLKKKAAQAAPEPQAGVQALPE
jgi:major membrane immunogen (membrane-anchored lipoprotein)